MCLGIPAKIVEIVDPENGIAKAEVSGVRRNVSTLLLDNDGYRVRVGDWILIHVGFALCKLSEKEAQETLALLDGSAFSDELTAPPKSDIE